MASSPAFASTPRVGMVNFTAANTALDGSGSLQTVVTAGASGTKINKVTMKYAATNTAGMIRLWIHDGTNGRLFKEFPTVAVTPSATAAAYSVEYNCEEENIFIPTGYSLRATTQAAEAINVIAFVADL